jgi:hypothetical protein
VVCAAKATVATKVDATAKEIRFIEILLESSLASSLRCTGPNWF